MIITHTAASNASIALQRYKENSVTKPQCVRTLIEARKALKRIKDLKLSELQYVPLYSESTHVKFYSDGFFQNLGTKH